MGVLFWVLLFPALGFIFGVLLGKLLGFWKKPLAAIGLASGLAFTVWLIIYHG